MGAYILRRLLLIIPTLLGILIVNFTMTQFVPGGPIEQIMARIEGEGDAFKNIAGGGDAGQNQSGGGESGYLGARGLPPEKLAELEVQMGFARLNCPVDFAGNPNPTDCVKEQISAPERFLIMVGNYARFDFGASFFNPTKTVVELVLEKMPVSITLGLWSTLLAYLISIPLGIRKAVHHGSAFDAWTSGLIIVAYAIPSFLVAILLLVLFAGGSYWQIFPLTGLASEGAANLPPLARALDYLWHIILPVTAYTIASFATLTLLTKNSFLDEITKQYVMTARAKGLSETRVLYGHVFRNAMLIVIAGFPALFLGVFMGGSILIETVFSLDGLGRMGYEAAINRDYPIIFGTLYVFGLISLLVGILSDLMYVFVDPRIDFEKRAG
jgi:microcin C transport system permease protein